MSGLRPVPFRKLNRELLALGFRVVRQRGSHVFYAHPDGRATTVPNHPGEEVGRGLVRAILRDVDVEWSEFEKLL